MNKIIELLLKLGINYYTESHIRVIDDFLKSNNRDITVLLDTLGTWDTSDLLVAQVWFKNI
jgi:hypothetical protein